MPLPNFTTGCFGIDVSPGNVCVSFPGGVQICANPPANSPASATDKIEDVFGKLNTAMAPLQPIFNMLDAILAIFEVIKAIATLDPAKIAAAIPGLAERINALLSLVPQLSLPLLVADAIGILIQYLSDYISRIERYTLYFERITAASLTPTTGGIQLGPIVDCASGNLDALLVNTAESAEPINRLIAILNTALQLLGLPCIPAIGAPSLNLGFTAALLKLIEFLQFLQKLITIPIPIPTIGVSSEDC